MRASRADEETAGSGGKYSASGTKSKEYDQERISVLWQSVRESLSEVLEHGSCGSVFYLLALAFARAGFESPRISQLIRCFVQR